MFDCMDRYAIHHHVLVIKDDIPKLSAENKRRVQKAIQRKLRDYPNTFGKPLKQALKHCRVLRVGDYRIVYRVRGPVVEIGAIIHRSSDYKSVRSRLSR